MSARTPRALAILLASLSASACLARASSAAERIELFRSDVELRADGSFVVEERIVYSFGSEWKRGIYRDIPVAYGRGSQPDYRIALDVLDVRDAHGQELPTKLTREGRTRRIRIGDPDGRVTGEHEYRIRYRVRRGVLWLEEHDELYWNVTGNDWSVPIDRAEAAVSTPSDRAAPELRVICFTGRQGSVETDCAHSAGERMIYVEASRPLGPMQGLTLVLALPKGLLDEPSALRKAWDRASDYLGWPTALPFLALFGMGAHWWRHGRDPAGPVAIPVRYEPPDRMTPAEMGVVHDQQVDTIDVTATLLDLAVRGFLRIEEVSGRGFLFLSESDYLLQRLDADEAAAKPFERKLLDALFGDARSVQLSSLRNRFYVHLPGIRDALYEEVSREGGWFPTRPDRVRARYVRISLLVCGLLAIAGFALERPSLLVSMLLCGAILGAFSVVMPRRTREGRRAYQHIRGFREFVERVEADRLERLGMRNLGQFERLLPFAFVLGVADAWADAFAGLYTEPPSWFVSDRGAFRPSHLVDRVGHALDTAGSTLTSEPSSSSGGSGSSGFGGGGSSGGGFGGGGGGSW